MAKKESVWGFPADRQIEEVNGWLVGVRRFDCEDGTSFYQFKNGRTRWTFDDPTASYHGWISNLPRKPKFATREAARAEAVKRAV